MSSDTLRELRGLSMRLLGIYHRLRFSTSCMARRSSGNRASFAPDVREHVHTRLQQLIQARGNFQCNELHLEHGSGRSEYCVMLESWAPLNKGRERDY